MFAEKVLGKTPDTTKDCSAFSQSIQEYASTDLYGFMTQACQLGVMGITSDGRSLVDFMPAQVVSRAEFGTVLSRMLYGNINEGEPRYANHLNALRENGIMTQIEDPLERKEVRQWVWLMLMRSAEW